MTIIHISYDYHEDSDLTYVKPLAMFLSIFIAQEMESFKKMGSNAIEDKGHHKKHGVVFWDINSLFSLTRSMFLLSLDGVWKAPIPSASVNNKPHLPRAYSLLPPCWAGY